MGIGKAIELLIEIYTKAKDNPQINDAVAYSLYKLGEWLTRIRRKENDMVADKIEIKIEPKLIIPRETADLCARILEAWLLSDDTANIEIINNGCEKEIYLTSMR